MVGVVRQQEISGAPLMLLVMGRAATAAAARLSRPPMVHQLEGKEVGCRVGRLQQMGGPDPKHHQQRCDDCARETLKQ